MPLVILLQTLLGYGKTQEMFLVAMRSSLFQLSIEAKQAIINAWQGMELLTVPPEHVAWKCFVSKKIFLIQTFSCFLTLRKNCLHMYNCYK